MDDVAELGRLLPVPDDLAEALLIEELGMRFVNAAAYCQTAARRLR